MMFSLQQITVLIQENSSYAGPLCLVVAFFGSLLATNLVVPSGAILTAIGVLIGAGLLSWTIVLWSAVGAAIGMSGSYSIGLRFGSRVENMPLLRGRSQLMERARRLFNRYGFISILIGYFSGPLRGPIATVAAIAGMPRGKFELANLVSALAWALTAVSIGAMPGSLITSNSIWLVVVALLVPMITIGISIAILILRSSRLN